MRQRAFTLLCFLALTRCHAREGEPTPDASASAAPSLDLSKLGAYTPPERKLDPAVVELGKLLFFDPRLSRDNDISCFTCHDPAKGWSDGRARPTGHRGKLLARNAPSVVNPDARLPMFWDGRAQTPEEQALGPITSNDEMAQPIDELVKELSSVPEYLARFEDAFPGRGVREETLARALADFERSLQSADAPFDRYLRGDESALTPEAVLGLGLFVGKGRCIKCHEGPHFTDASFHNLGVGNGDEGRFKIIALPVLAGAFKTPGLRDVALTAPYMHDGSVTTLEAVIDLYDKGGGDDRKNLDADIVALSLTPAEKAALVAFMQALTGQPIVVARPELPRNAHDPKRSLQSLMSEVDGMLDAVDRALQSLNESNWGQLPADVTLLLHNAEDLGAIRLARVKEADYPRFHLFQGRLILAIKALSAAAEKRSRADAGRAYQLVRERCNDCHEVFRPDDKHGKAKP